MRWVKGLWDVCTSVVGTGIDYAASFLNKLGSLSSIVGGAGLAVASVAEEQVNVSYYGSANVPGELLIGITVPQLNFYVNETIPFQHTWSKAGGIFYNSKDYIAPNAIAFVSGMLVLSGTFVQVIAANIKIKRRYIEDKKALFIEEANDDLAPPSTAEYKYAMAEAACRSLANASLSYSIVGSLLSFSELNQMAQSFTYPSSGEPAAANSSYSGPVTSELIPVALDISENITIEIPLIKIGLLIQQVAKAEAVANVSYGGGLFFKSQNKSQPLVVAPAVLAIGAHAAGNFFERKGIRSRDTRIADSHDLPYKFMA